MFGEAGKLFVRFQRRSSSAALLCKIGDKTQFVWISSSQRNGMVPMYLGIQNGVALLRRAGAKTFNYRRIQRDVAPAQNIIDIVPALQAGHCIQVREQKLVVFQRAFNRESREDELG